MQFQTKEEADRFIAYNAEEIKQKSGYAPVRSYYCKACCCYHLTSKEKRGVDTPAPRLDVLDGTVVFQKGRKRALIRGDALEEAREYIRVSTNMVHEFCRRERKSAINPLNILNYLNNLTMMEPHQFNQDALWKAHVAKQQKQLANIKDAEENRRVKINLLLNQENERFAGHIKQLNDWKTAHPACAVDAELAIMAARQLKFDIVGRLHCLPWTSSEWDKYLASIDNSVQQRITSIAESLKEIEHQEALAMERIREIEKNKAEAKAKQEAEKAAKKKQAAAAAASTAAKEAPVGMSLDEYIKRQQEAGKPVDLSRLKKVSSATTKDTVPQELQDEDLEFLDKPDPNAVDISVDNQINVSVYKEKNGTEQGVIVLSTYLGQLLLEKGYYTASLAKTKDGSLCIAFGVKSDIQIDINYDGQYFLSSHKMCKDILTYKKSKIDTLNIQYKIGHKPNYSYIKL